ncbi:MULTISPECIES: response regulator [Thalassolituus]|jgi:two-component system response regulator CpxR|uniref:Two-component system, OmpR family, response regulator CpxR n=1 Tax=Thalassolituus maritimus TaxID=484498 RepID=A0A1N7JLT0_9GAMM|nr:MULTISPECIES: response regulator [Thalassolituus]KZZ05454.1 DNA-binding response regulator [Oleibacter sp. HI0075]MEC8907459.1 response regulator [Pseudomonadota bacterium]HCG77625.1 DNA-binding response regulator [Oceanospirillales bacterium]KZZ08654.1 DNA-binding response regulator [Oleibacter sp. HI0075]SIS50288.1 two-component system, OmpR family, response regulator CpxR [Thalassolituus maritimus]|tara:strand:- start:1563 stop:2255 length:693 start_codon:yes stop_codon:yes gene_type:complete
MKSVLLIDDDVELGELLKEYLSMEGFELTAVHDGESGLQQALSGDYSLVLLDVMLPKKNGFEVLRELRQKSSIPVIMLTARGESVDRVLGLEHGADDYIPKPYHHHELMARIKALFRRIEMSAEEPESTSNELKVGELELNPATRTATRSGEELPLTGAEFGVLQCLMENVGDLVDKDSLSMAALGRQLMAYDRSIDMHVSNLRKKLGKRDDDSDWIKTVRSRGYMLVRV